MATGLASLASRVLEIAEPGAGHPALVPMQPLAALGLVFGAVALWLMRREAASSAARRGAQACAVSMSLLALPTILHLVAGAGAAAQAPAPGYGVVRDALRWVEACQPKPLAAVSLLGLSGALWALGRAPPAVGLSRWLAVGAGLAVLPSFVSYAYILASVADPMSPGASMYATWGLLLLSLGILFARRQDGFIRIITSSGAVGTLVRRSLAAALVIPILCGWLRLLGERGGLYPAQTGPAVIVTLLIVVFIAMVRHTACSLDRAERQRLAAAEDLRRQRGLLSSILASMSEAVVVADEQGRFLLFNPTAERILGRGPADVPPLRWTEHYGVYRPDGVTPVPADELPLVRAMRGEVCDDVELVIRNPGVPEGARISVSGRPLRSAEPGGARGGVVVFRDISELRRMQDELRDLNRRLEQKVEERTRELREANAALEQANESLRRRNAELDEFTYLASHDLQEPLRKLISFSALLERDVGTQLNESARRDLGYISDAASRMQNLVRDLLALSRAGRAAMRREPVPLDRCVDGALSALTTRIEQTQAQITRDPLPTVTGDGTLLTQLYQNLIGNALKFVADRPPRIHLTAERRGTQWVLGVRDNGIGVPPEYREQIFAPFKRLHGREKYEGTGVGLAICRKAVERHGGTIWVDAAPQGGAHFRFTLPCDAEDVPCNSTTDLPSSSWLKTTPATRS